MKRTVFTTISLNLYKLILKEKERLKRKESKKRRRKRITSYDASESIYRRATR